MHVFISLSLDWGCDVTSYLKFLPWLQHTMFCDLELWTRLSSSSPELLCVRVCYHKNEIGTRPPVSLHICGIFLFPFAVGVLCLCTLRQDIICSLMVKDVWPVWSRMALGFWSSCFHLQGSAIIGMYYNSSSPLLGLNPGEWWILGKHSTNIPTPPAPYLFVLKKIILAVWANL